MGWGGVSAGNFVYSVDYSVIIPEYFHFVTPFVTPPYCTVHSIIAISPYFRTIVPLKYATLVKITNFKIKV